MIRTITALKRYWMQPAPPERLAVLRIASGLFCLWYLTTRFAMLQKAARNSESFDAVGPLFWMDKPIDPNTFWWISVGMIVLNIAFVLGWKFKYTGPLFAISVLFYFSYRNSWSMIYHNRNGLVLHLMILGMVAAADQLSLDSFFRRKKKLRIPIKSWHYGWPIQLIKAITVGAYFLSGVAKLAGELSWEWITGNALRSQIAVDAIRKEMLGSHAPVLFDTLFEHTWVFMWMGITTFVLELGAPLALYNRNWGKVWAWSTLGMHWGIYAIMGITFRYQMTGLIFLSFFNIEKLFRYIDFRNKN